MTKMPALIVTQSGGVSTLSWRGSAHRGRRSAMAPSNGCFHWMTVEAIACRQGKRGPVTTYRCTQCGATETREEWRDNKTTGKEEHEK